jgi:poly-D-alanine transfer protein DltD
LVADLADHVGIQRFVNEYVRVPRQGDQAWILDRISGNRDGPSFVVEPVGYSWLNWIMID